MVKKLLPAIATLIFFSSCSTFKPLNFTSNRQVSSSLPVPASQTKFIDEISVTPEQFTTAPAQQATVAKKESRSQTSSLTSVSRGINIIEAPVQKQGDAQLNEILAGRHEAAIENASSTQLKYAVLLNTEVESLPSKSLLDDVDEWYGVRYRTGGNTKTGVDCSGFTVAVYLAAYGIALPRVSRDQYRISRKISTTELQEGDLVFFNTNGRGVSHVGIYLGNNKFIHASVSRGVMVSGLFEPYYLKRYYGAGRIEDKQLITTAAAD